MGVWFSCCYPSHNAGYTAIPGNDNVAITNLHGSSYQQQMKENDLIALQASNKLDPNKNKKEMNIESAFQSSTEEFMDILKEVSAIMCFS